MLHKILIFSKYTLFSVTIISRPFILIIILDYTSNMVVHINSKYTFIHLCIFIRLPSNWSHLQLMGRKLFFLDVVHMEG
jgi:hypothetical protein